MAPVKICILVSRDVVPSPPPLFASFHCSIDLSNRKRPFNTYHKPTYKYIIIKDRLDVVLQSSQNHPEPHIQMISIMSGPAEQIDVSSSTPTVSLGSLPLELLQEVSSYLEPHDVGNLRRASVTCSKIGFQYMLSTIPFRLTCDSVARVLALSEVPAFSKCVQRLAFNTVCPNQFDKISKQEYSFLKSKHALTLERLTLKYASSRPALKDDSNNLDGGNGGPHLPALFLPGSCNQLRGARSYTEADDEMDGWPNHETLCVTKPSVILGTLRACLDKFRNLQELSIGDNGFRYHWVFPTELSVYEDTCLLSAGPTEVIKLVRQLLIDLGMNQVRSIRVNISLATDRSCVFASSLATTFRLDKVKHISLIFFNDSDRYVDERAALGGAAGVCESILTRHDALKKIEMKFVCSHNPGRHTIHTVGCYRTYQVLYSTTVDLDLSTFGSLTLAISP